MAGWSRRFWLSHRRENSRGVLLIVMDRVDRLDGIGGKVDRQRLACLRVWLIERRAGAGDRHANAMTFVENLADPADVEGELRRFAWRKQRFAIEAVAVAGPPGVIDDQDRPAVGIDVADADNEVGVFRGG